MNEPVITVSYGNSWCDFKQGCTDVDFIYEMPGDERRASQAMLPGPCVIINGMAFCEVCIAYMTEELRPVVEVFNESVARINAVGEATAILREGAA